MLSFIGGYMGVNLTPTHLCLCMTREYFGVSYNDIYKKLIPVFLVFMCAVVLFYLLSFPPANVR